MTIRIGDIVPLSIARARFSELADEVRDGGAKIITKNGAAYVALIDARRLDHYHRLERDRAERDDAGRVEAERGDAGRGDAGRICGGNGSDACDDADGGAGGGDVSVAAACASANADGRTIVEARDGRGGASFAASRTDTSRDADDSRADRGMRPMCAAQRPLAADDG
ncbi:MULTISPECIES: type II toxin-antitoxin system Phd/YefM family antitoxin [Burkholderia]|uniref:type II toxin-antitoxin system Phd/YefM family antitoxin n=1 Tax=Burkholderia TaxID=32008 RepID=UPI00075C3AC0|nr:MULTISPECIES: type II toxin-antitoxin system Phd/YefM family antitoxin [Burkholderia]AOJ71256.1 hypothetical protein WS78_20565 [Burkholderia savannae]KVG48676.1 hypothetical protein WS77_02785 [Burkholderia sp. MSMB0265]KVG86132.1 hypothetical protein WS81_29450 [Burkholderia sp. MSMB2040]KVG90415.1 hypothetical protein WS82_16920 [Burkholderia sp. MSMB2041]KVH00069.1 hypothetical protein WS83_22690 [Burkholderia sp. MSMB2042]